MPTTNGLSLALELEAEGGTRPLCNLWRTGIRSQVRGLISHKHHVPGGGVTPRLLKKVPCGNVGHKPVAGLMPKPAPFERGGWGRFSWVNDAH